jgi:predicted Zn-dependent protease
VEDVLEGSKLSTLKLVRIGRPVSRSELEALAERIREAFAGLLESIQTVDYEPPNVEEIEADILTQALDQHVGGHILGITEADLLDGSATDFFKFMFGCKDNRNDVAVVSTRRIASPDPTRSITRLLKVGLHELGHNFGLVHHYAFVPVSDGAYCPMTKGDYNRHGERSYTRSVIDARGFHFCDTCRRFLRLAHGALS